MEIDVLEILRSTPEWGETTAPQQTARDALTGALTRTPAPGLVNQQAGSSVPALGYAGTYAFANIVLAFIGAAVVRF